MLVGKVTLVPDICTRKTVFIEGVRMSTALSYLNPQRHRLNLTIKANVVV